MFIWGSKVAGRPWVRTTTQYVSRLLGGFLATPHQVPFVSWSEPTKFTSYVGPTTFTSQDR